MIDEQTTTATGHQLLAAWLQVSGCLSSAASSANYANPAVFFAYWLLAIGHWLFHLPWSLFLCTAGEYRVYYRQSDMVNPGPAMTFVFVDEPMDRINDGFFVTDMLTYPATTEDICDYPAQYHSGGASFSFADGHSQLKKWTTPQLLQPPQWYKTLDYPTPLSAFNRDVFWLMDHATRLVE